MPVLMPFFFDKKPSVRSKWTIKDAKDSTVSLSPNIWHSLGFTENSSVCISVRATGSRNRPDEQGSLLCWATLDDQVDNHSLAIPQSWATSYQHVFKSSFSGDVLVQPTLPSFLTVVVIVALSDEAYSQASNDLSILDKFFSDERTILRQGDIFTVKKPALKKHDCSGTLRYRLELLEPVLQGYVRHGKTKIILLSSVMDITTDNQDSLDEEDGIEIDEGFLASSVLSPAFELSHRIQSHEANAAEPIAERSSIRYTSKSLDIPYHILDDHCTLYLRTADLGKAGIQSGDWAIASVEPSNSRLVRIIANDDLVNSPGFVAGSPLLLHNIFADEGDTYVQTPPDICICPSPFGSCNPAIPVARSVTIARVASPTSINRQFQPLFIHSLKTYFDSGKRLVKQGDLFAVSIDTDLSRWSFENDNKQDHSTNAETEPNEPSNSTWEPRPNELVFFKVTNIEYDVMSRYGSSAQDSYTGSTLGELGCWIDTTVTRMVQTGVEHSRVPNTGTYMQLDPSGVFAKLQSQASPHLLGPKSPYSKLLALTSAALSQRAADYNLHLTFLLKGGRSIGKFTVASWVAERLGLHLFEVDCYDILGENDVKTEATMRVRFEQATSCTPCLFVLRHLEALSQTTQSLEASKESAIVNTMREALDNLQSSWKITGYPVIVIGTTSESGRVSPGLLSCFKQDLIFEAPNEGERLEILICLLAEHTVASDVSLQNLATQTAALLAGDLRDLVARAKAASIERATSTIALEKAEYSISHVSISAADFEVALGKARDSYSESIGAPNIPSVSWDDVGGLAHVKSDILDTIQLPLDHPELFADGLKKRSGILLYGPPGTGKTLIAKAVATSCSLNFFSVKGPELLNMYIGESEANVRRVFQRARDAKPCVIFFDELDSVAPKRGIHGDSGGVMDRIVSQLLAELDGMAGGKEGADVFVIGATNRPDLLDPALLRPGRFDRMLYLGVSDTHEAQLNILEALTRKFRLDPNLSLRSVAERCPFNYTGADFYALCSDAMLNAMSRKAEVVEEKISILNVQPPQHGQPHPITPQYYLAELASAEDITVHVSEEDFERALQGLVPSVSQAEMEHYAHVQRRFSQKGEDEIES